MLKSVISSPMFLIYFFSKKKIESEAKQMKVLGKYFCSEEGGNADILRQTNVA